MALLPHKLKHHPALSVFFHGPAHATPAASMSRTLLASRGPFQKEACCPRLWLSAIHTPRLRWGAGAQWAPSSAFSAAASVGDGRSPLGCITRAGKRDFANAPGVAKPLLKRSLLPAFMAFRSLNTTLRRSNSRTLLASRGPFQKEARGPRPRILWPIVPQNSPRCKQTRPALTVGRIPLRRDERAPPSAEGPAPIQNLYSKPHKIHRP